jgi:hypothetical protein
VKYGIDPVRKSMSYQPLCQSGKLSMKVRKEEMKMMGIDDGAYCHQYG